MTKKKQAVVVIHGMGQQKPMDTLRSFVETVWVKCPYLVRDDGAEIRDNDVWSKPDRISTSLELRRLTTRHSFSGKVSEEKSRRTDFYEYYWAHRTQTNTFQHFWDWFRTLLLRIPFISVPFRVLHIWFLLWGTTLLTLAYFSSQIWLQNEGEIPFLPEEWSVWLKGFHLGWSAAIGLVLFLLNSILVHYFGDVARYVRAAPGNIKARHDIRQDGLEFLERLHESKEYDRIIIVGHSLGSIVAYDLITLLWEKRNRRLNLTYNAKALRALKVLEKIVSKGRSASRSDPPLQFTKISQKRFRCVQRKLSEALAEDYEPQWLISDFVSIGSPLTHADFLLARSKPYLDRKLIERELSYCPPVSDDLPTVSDNHENHPTNFWTYRVSYSPGRKTIPHVGAAFAAVRWTNIYDPPLGPTIVFGDQISGPVADHFGEAVKDVDVSICRGTFGIWRFATHTHYWTWNKNWDQQNSPKHVQELWEALDLLDNGGKVGNEPKTGSSTPAKAVK